MLSSSKRKKKALNKSTWFEINPKSVYTSRDEGFDVNSVSTSQNDGLVEKYNLSGPKDCFHLNQCLKK